MKHPKMYEGKSPVHKLYWFQYFLIDVILFYLFIGYLFFKIMKFIFSLLYSCCCSSKKEKIKLEWRKFINKLFTAFDNEFRIWFLRIFWSQFCHRRRQTAAEFFEKPTGIQLTKAADFTQFVKSTLENKN